MRKTKKSLIYVLALSMILLCACGSGSYSKSDSASVERIASEAYDSKVTYDDVYAEEYYEYEDAEAPANGSEPVDVQDTSRKLIKDVSMNVETNDMDVMVSNINLRIKQYGGYIENSYIDNNPGSRYERNAQMTIRIPAKHLDEFVNTVGESSNVINKSESVTDVTLQYVDIEARKSSLETEQKRLLELMEKAETIEDILYIEDRLTDIRYQLESAERQLRSYDNLVDYSTVYISISEVKEYTPVVVEEKTRWQKIKEGFADSLETLFEGILDGIAALIIALPFIIVIAAFVGLLVFAILRIIYVCTTTKEERKAKKALKKAKKAGLYVPEAKEESKALDAIKEPKATNTAKETKTDNVVKKDEVKPENVIKAAADALKVASDLAGNEDSKSSEGDK